MADCPANRKSAFPVTCSLLLLLIKAYAQRTAVVEGTMVNITGVHPEHSTAMFQDKIGNFLEDDDRSKRALNASLTFMSSIEKDENSKRASADNGTQSPLSKTPNPIGNLHPEISSPVEPEDGNRGHNLNLSTNLTKSQDKSPQSRSVFKFDFIAQGIISPMIVFPGIVCNLINILVLLKQGTSQSTVRYLIALSIFDLLYLIFVAFDWVLLLLKTFYNKHYLELMLVMRFLWVRLLCILSMGKASNLLIVVMSVERFVAVRFPFAAKSSPLTRHSAKVISCVAIFAIGFLVPNMIKEEFVKTTDQYANETYIILQKTDFALRNKDFYNYYVTSILVILRLVPVSVVLILNTAIITSLHTGNDLDVSTPTTDEKRQMRQLKITRMLVAISVLFLLCVSPGLIHSLVSNFYANYNRRGSNKGLYFAVGAITNLLDNINSTGNFFIYIWMSERFRLVFRSKFCHDRQQVMEPNITGISTKRYTEGTESKENNT